MSGYYTDYFLGLDISTQTVSALLIGVSSRSGVVEEIILQPEWRSSRSWSSESDRKSPDLWVELTRQLIAELKAACPHTSEVRAIGVSTAFPGIFAVLGDGRIDPRFVCLYDNTNDGGLCEDVCSELLAAAEDETMNRMWPGNMAIGLVHLVRDCGLSLPEVSALVPPNTAFCYALSRACRTDVGARALPTDFTQAIISGLYDAKSALPVPTAVAKLLENVLQGYGSAQVAGFLPRAVPSWRNSVPGPILKELRDVLGLPRLEAVSIGAGDSPLGALALGASSDRVLDVRGSSDSPVLAVPSVKPRHTPRETVLHYPLPTATSPADSPWCAVAPMLRSGKVWDWVKRLRFSQNDPDADGYLEKLAAEALKRRFGCGVPPLWFDTALGGERAPDWNAHATGRIQGLVEQHELGDIALAALEGLSIRLRYCVGLMESRYGVRAPKLLLAGGPARNSLWSWITGLFLGKEAYRSGFTDASLLGAAMLGYAASLDGRLEDAEISHRLGLLARLASEHPIVQASPVTAPDGELSKLETAYRSQIAALCGEV